MPEPSKHPVVRISSSQSAMRVPRKRITELISYVAAAEGQRIADVDVAVVTAEEIAGLNRQWVGHTGPTDVISFDLSDDRHDGIAAQLILCGDVAVRQAPRHGLGVQHELLLYLVHGLLHLMGYDDQAPRQAARMSARQEEILTAFHRGAPPPTASGQPGRGGHSSGGA